MSFFDYLDTNTELATVCNNAMTAMIAMASDALVVAYDYAGFERIVDVGGGHGPATRPHPHAEGGSFTTGTRAVGRTPRIGPLRSVPVL